MSLQPCESNWTTDTCPLGGRRHPHTHHVSHWLRSQPSSLTLLTFKTSEANYPLCAHYWLVGKVSSTGFLTRNWKPVTEHWHSICLPMELWVSQDKMYTTTKGGNRRNSQFPFEEIWLEELFRQSFQSFCWDSNAFLLKPLWISAWNKFIFHV